ncbi:MAG: PQQ-binding-like beta-propeller repeat protein [Caldilineaceae bacterium]|nr:PQQ-binding-like beta-propeller repeat protein [Caldilineaceae bacterium]
MGKSDTSHRLVSSRCPECGAPVDFRNLPRDQAQVKCTYCGTLINIPGRSHAHTATSPHTRPTAAVFVTSEPRRVKVHRGCGVTGLLVLGLVLLFAGMGLWSTGWMTPAMRLVNQVVSNGTVEGAPDFPPISLPPIEQAFAPKPRLVSAPLRLAGDESAPVQMILTAYQEDGSVLLGFDPAHRLESWRSPTFSERYYEMGLSGDAARVYVADGAKLVALDRATGQTLWQTSLANNLQTTCTAGAPCLQQVGDQVVALARDGTLQGFAGATGAALWSRRLNSTPRQFLVNGDQVIVVDTDESNRAVVLVFNGVNGDLVYELRPACTFPNIEMRPSASDQYLITPDTTPDGSALLVAGSGNYACAWRYQLTDGALTWSFIPSDGNGSLPFAWALSSLAISDPMLYFVNVDNDAAQIFALDTQSQGSMPESLYRIENYQLTILYALDDLLLVSAQPGFARDEVELWAIDRGTGERRWQRKLETTHTFDEWVTHPTDQGIFLAVCFWESDECRFELLDRVTGASRGQVREATGGRFEGAAWIDDRGYLTIDGKLYAVNLTSAAIEYTWP